MEEYPFPTWYLSDPLLSQATLHSRIIAGALGPYPFSLAWGWGALTMVMHRIKARIAGEKVALSLL